MSGCQDTTLHVGRVAFATLLLASATLAATAQSQQSPSVPTRQQATAAPLPFDSALVRELLGDAVMSAREAPSPSRGDLLAAIGRMQVEVRDFAGAERTLVLDAGATPDRVSSALGQPAWFGMLERAGLTRFLTCALREEGRPADALAAVRRLPPGAAREWELAHEAALTARVARWLPQPAAAGRGDLATRRRDALAIAREVKLPDAQLDALLAIAWSALDSLPDVDLAQSAYAEARRIRLMDADRQQQRNAMLAALALRIDRTDDARSLYATLVHPEDLRYVISSAAADASSKDIVRELAPRAAAAAARIRDPAARRVYETHLHAVLTQAGEHGLADALLPEPSDADADDSGEAWRQARDSALAASDHPRDAAQRALQRAAFAEVRRAVARLPRVDAHAERAGLLSDLAWGAYQAHRDTARAYLVSAHAALLESGADSATFDERAASIANRQFWIADHDGAVETLNLIRDQAVAEGVADDVGSSTFSKLAAADVRALADRVRAPRVREAMLTRLVSGYLLARQATDAEVRWAHALADSIVTTTHRVTVRLAVAAHALQRGDSIAARRGYLAALGDSAWTNAPTTWIVRQALFPLVSVGAWQEVMAWGRAPTSPALRAQRLMFVATALHQQLETARQGGLRLIISNGPHWCRHGF